MASLQKCRCWLFDISNCDSTAAYPLIAKASYVCWDYDDELRKITGYVQYATCCAAAKIVGSKWCKSSASFVESDNCYKQNVFGVSTHSIKIAKAKKKLVLPEVLDPATFQLLQKRDNWIKTNPEIENKVKYISAADRKRRSLHDVDLAKTAKTIKYYKLTPDYLLPILPQEEYHYNPKDKS